MLELSSLQGGAVVGAWIHTWRMDEASHRSRHPPMHSFTDFDVELLRSHFCSEGSPSGEPTASTGSVAAGVMDFGEDETLWSFEDACDAEEDFTGIAPQELDFMEGPPEEEPDMEPAPLREESNSEPTAGCHAVVLPMDVEVDAGSADVSAMDQSHPSGSSGDVALPIVSEGAGNGVAQDSTANAETPGHRRRQDPPSEPTAAEAGNAPKFRRVQEKTKVPGGVVPVPRPHAKDDMFAPVRGLLASVSVKEEWVSPLVWNKMDHRQQYLFVFEKTRSFYVKIVHHMLMCRLQEGWQKLSGLDRQKAGRQSWSALQQEHKEEVFHMWAGSSAAPEHVRQFIQVLLDPERHSPSYKMKARGALLTWQISEQVADLSQEPIRKDLNIDTVAEHLRSLPPVRRLWEGLQEHGEECKRAAKAEDVAICLELCPTTWAQQGALKLHAHCFLKTSGDFLRLRDLRPCCFQGIAPHASSTIGGLTQAGNRSASWSGFFYCGSGKKIGQLWSAASRQAFSQYLVNPSWIMNMLQGKKITMTDAREQLVQCRNASRWIRELECVEREEEKAAVVAAMAKAQELLAPCLLKFRSYKVVDEFVAQFEQAKQRYKFLVLAGPSRVGKTVYARSLAPIGTECLEVNCSSGQEPDIRAYRLSRHGVILFDEVEASQVVAQRKMFQACASAVQLGCSATNCHSYTVFLWRKRLVLASNKWHTSVAELAKEDQAWVEANSMVLDVESPMWEE